MSCPASSRVPGSGDVVSDRRERRSRGGRRWRPFVTSGDNARRDLGRGYSQRGSQRIDMIRFRTRVITEDVTPSLHVDYKHSKIKQYHKLGKALRTETTINDTADFGVAKGLSHLPELKEIGFTASRRLLDVQRISHDPAEGAAALTALNNPVTSPAGTRTAGMPLTSPPRAGPAVRLVRLPAAAPRFHQPRPAHLPRAPAGAHSRGHDQRADQLRPATAPHPRAHPAHPAQLPLPGHPRRHPAGNVPDPPDPAAAHHRPGRACPARSPAHSRLRTAARAYDAAIDDLARQSGLAA